MTIVLCIDDDCVGLEGRKSVLEEEGYEVIAANSGEEGLAIIRSGRPIDIVILDYFMPNMSGMETA